MSKFELGRTVMTASVAQLATDNEQFSNDIFLSLQRYENCDWSDMKYDEDKETNNEAIEFGDMRIFATYNTCEGVIWIITEADRSVTTILFPQDY